MSDPRISVALCTYNGARFLSKQLDSIAAQIRPADEVIICDDCSTDRTVDISRTFAAGAPFPVSVIVNDSRLGSTKNFEKVVSLCRFEVIALCDQDDVWHPRKLNRMAEVFRRGQHIGATFSDADLIDEDSQLLGKTLWTSYSFNLNKQKKFENMHALEVLLRHPTVTGATMAFRSQYRDLLLPIPSKQVHDHWMAMLIASVSQLIPLRDSLIRYRQHQSQQIGPGKQLSLWERLPRRVEPEYYLTEAERLAEVRDRLQSCDPTFPAHPNALHLIREKIKHRTTRAEFPKSKILRLPTVIREVATLRYWRYSSGAGSVAKDVFL